MGLTINVSYDSSVSNAPAGFETAVAAAVLFYEQAFTNNITINIDVGYGEVDGSPVSPGDLAQNRFTGGGFLTYLQVKNALSNNVSSADDAAAVASLPASDPTNGAAFLVSPAEEQALGLSPLTPTVDGYIGVSSADSFSWDSNNRAVPGLVDSVGAIEHEISELMGRFGSLDKYQGFNYTPLDLFRYSSPGIRDLTPGPGYFSIDGQTLLTAYNNPLNGGDPADWVPSLKGDSYGDGFAGVVNSVSPTDLRVMNILGYDLAASVIGLAVVDTTTGQPVAAIAQPYTGPVSGLQEQYINLNADSLNITANTPNWFIHSGSGTDAIAASSGTNVLDGGTGSNFLTAGSGTDTFFVDDRGPTADIWSTVAGFHSGDAATVWGVTPQDFNIAWVDGQGVGTFTGLTLHATADGKPTASVTLAGFSSADLSNGRLGVSFGTVGTSDYMIIQGH